MAMRAAAGCPFLRSLNARGLSGVRLVIRDAWPLWLPRIECFFDIDPKVK